MSSDRSDAPDLEVSWLADGLVPAVVQDVADRRVLMVGYMDAEALAATLATGDVHFHSRSRGTLWRKGETSGNVLRLRRIEADCDADALLVAVEPSGPTCHRGTRSCFDGMAAEEAGVALQGAAGATPLAARPAEGAAAPAPHARGSGEGFAWLEELWATIEARGRTRPIGSYTARLLEGGVDVAGRKVTEEATEVLIAAKDHAAAGDDAQDGARAALVGEAADLAYHALVLLAERGVRPVEVIEVLRARHSGSQGS